MSILEITLSIKEESQNFGRKANINMQLSSVSDILLTLFLPAF